MENNQPPFIYTEDQLMVRLKFFIGICLALTLTGIVFVVLYSIIFVTQPLNAISPIDQKFFELIIPIATFLTGTLSGIMLAGNKKEDQDAMLAAQKQAAANAESAAKASSTPAAAPAATGAFGGASGLGTFGGASSFNRPAVNTGMASTATTTASTAEPVFGGATADIGTGYGGRAAPPPVTTWPER